MCAKDGGSTSFGSAAAMKKTPSAICTRTVSQGEARASFGVMTRGPSRSFEIERRRVDELRQRRGDEEDAERDLHADREPGRGESFLRRHDSGPVALFRDRKTAGRRASAAPRR